MKFLLQHFPKTLFQMSFPCSNQIQQRPSISILSILSGYQSLYSFQYYRNSCHHNISLKIQKSRSKRSNNLRIKHQNHEKAQHNREHQPQIHDKHKMLVVLLSKVYSEYFCNINFPNLLVRIQV